VARAQEWAHRGTAGLQAGSGDNAVPDRKGFPMSTSAPRFSPDPHFEALKSLTRLQWMLNFEAVASVPNKANAIGPEPMPRLD
jgi:hypothetical protein